MVRQTQLRAAGRLVGEAVVGVATTVREVHRAVGRRVGSVMPPVARGVTDLQLGLTDAVYGGVVLGTRLVAPLVAEAVARYARPGTTALSETWSGRHVLGAVNGIWGDTIAERQPHLAFPASLRVDHVDLPLEPGAVAAAVPEPTGRVVVFVHGLSENDLAWFKGWKVSDDPQASYGGHLHADLGYTPLYLHYNSGHPISDNGRELAELLERLVASWPVPVERLALIGHSMGGLVVRSACRHGELAEQRWVPLVRTVVTLGTPHLGAPLEKVVHLAERLLSVAPESLPISEFLARRSAGVQDLRFGALVPGDRLEGDATMLYDDCTDVPLLPQVTYCFVSGGIGRGERNPVGQLLGDGLVRRSSAAATGRSPREPLAAQHRVHFAGRHHFSLLNDPEVYAHLKEWLGPA